MTLDFRLSTQSLNGHFIRPNWEVQLLGRRASKRSPRLDEAEGGPLRWLARRDNSELACPDSTALMPHYRLWVALGHRLWCSAWRTERCFSQFGCIKRPLAMTSPGSLFGQQDRLHPSIICGLLNYGETWITRTAGDHQKTLSYAKFELWAMLSLCFSHVVTVASPFRSSVFHFLAKICEIFFSCEKKNMKLSVLHKNLNTSSHRKGSLMALTTVYQFELWLILWDIPSELSLPRQGPCNLVWVKQVFRGRVIQVSLWYNVCNRFDSDYHDKENILEWS